MLWTNRKKMRMKLNSNVGIFKMCVSICSVKIDLLIVSSCWDVTMFDWIKWINSRIWERICEIGQIIYRCWFAFLNPLNMECFSHSCGFPSNLIPIVLIKMSMLLNGNFHLSSPRCPIIYISFGNLFISKNKYKQFRFQFLASCKRSFRAY